MLGWLLGQLLGVPAFAALRLSVAGLAVGTLAALPMLVGVWIVVSVPWDPFRRLLREVDELVAPLFARCRLHHILVIAAAAGLGEEVLFRGVLQTALVRPFGTAGGLAAASVVFGLLHFVTPTYALLAALAGAYLGLLFLACDNLLVPVVAHGVYDFVALAYLVGRAGKREK